MLVEELNHRFRNMLNVVGAVVSETLDTSSSTDEFRENFLGRMQAMSRSYSLVAKEGWSDVGLREIVMNEMSAV